MERHDPAKSAPALFEDRQDAGRKLAEKLREFESMKQLVVLGLPRGGMPVAAEVAKALHAPLGVLVARKLPIAEDPERAIGAVAEGDVVVWDLESARWSSEDYLNQAQAKETLAVDVAAQRYRGGPPELSDRTVILVDDGAATGYTLRAAARAAKKFGAREVIAAVPAIAPGAIHSVATDTDRLIYVECPPHFTSVGAAYRHFPQVAESEVDELLNTETSRHVSEDA